jgi:hypothetical protein
MSRVHWVELRPRDPASAGLVTLRFAGGARERSYYREENGQHYKAGLVAAPRFAARIGFGKDGFTGQTVPQASRIQIAPGEAQVFESLAGYFWKDAAITIDAGPEDADVFPRLFTGTVVGDSIADGVFTLTIADLSTRLDKPVCTTRFAGNGGIEGGEEAEGRTKRRNWGFVFNVEGRLLDPANSIYEFGDPAFPFSSWTALRDKGRGGPFTVLAWQGSIAATFAALQASTPVQGGGVVAPSIACAKWWTEPSGPLTADFVGTPGTGGAMAAAALIDAISANFSGPPVADRIAATALRPAAAGIHVGDETTTGAQLIDRLALGSSLMWVAAPEGVIRLLPWTFGNGGAAVLQGQFIGRERAYAPHYRRRVGFQANNRRHSESEIAESIRLDDGVLFESLRPAEPNATAGAVIPDPLTYVPGDPYPGYIRDSAGNVRPPGQLLNSALIFRNGKLDYLELPDAEPINLGRVTTADIGAATASSLRQADDSIARLAATATFLLSESSRTRELFRDGGFYVDPVTKQVRIHSVEQTRERLSKAEITLDGALASINLKASFNYVNEQIALAAFDPSQIADLEMVFSRLNEAEIAIDGLNAFIISRASASELSTVSLRVNTAEEKIDALEGEISDKVGSTEFNALDTRVSQAEELLETVPDAATIRNSVTTTRLVQLQQEENAEKDLIALVLSDRAQRSQVQAIAIARNELGTRITEQDGRIRLVAEFGLALQVELGRSVAGLTAQSVVLADDISAVAQDLTDLQASFEGQFGTLLTTIDDLSQAFSSEQETSGLRFSEIESTIGQQGEDLEAIGARVEDVEQTSANIDGRLTAGLQRSATVGRINDIDLQGLANRMLQAVALTDSNARKAFRDVAFFREEIVTDFTANKQAVASSLIALGAELGDAIGQISELNRVVLTPGTGVVQQLNSLSLSTTVAIGSINTAIETTQGDLSSAIGRVDGLEDDRDTTFDLLGGLEEQLAAVPIAIEAAINQAQTIWQEADNLIVESVTELSGRVGDNETTILESLEIIDGLLANYGLKIDINGRITGFGVNASPTASIMRFLMDIFQLVDPVTGEVYLGADSSGKLRLRNGTLQMDNGTVMLVIGLGFGVDNKFVLWFGPSRAINLCNETDASFWLDTGGQGLWGLRFASQVISNTNEATSTASDAMTAIGPFRTEGNPKQVEVGYIYDRLVQITDAFAYSGTPQATLRLERRLGDGAWAFVGEYTFNGEAFGEDGFGAAEPGSARIRVSGNASFTDNTGGTAFFTYRARLITRSVSGLTSTVSLEDSLNQRIILTSNEQLS